MYFFFPLDDSKHKQRTIPLEFEIDVRNYISFGKENLQAIQLR
jgi:hypothetical protein